MDTYSIILIISIIAGFLMVFSLGANDVANAMASAVASKALSVRQAIFLAAALNFIGAVFFGSEVIGTIAKGIIRADVFTDKDIFMVGMLAALFSAGLWVLIASITSFPVSSTHSIIGSLIGFGLASGHHDAIQWGSLSMIVLAWIMSPFIGALFSFTVFTMVRRLILYRKNIMYHAMLWVPFWVGMTIAIVFLSFCFKTSVGRDLQLNGLLGATLSLCIVAAFVVTGLLFRKYHHSIKLQDGRAAQKVENMFGKMQISTSCFLALSQGSNDVANAIGPVAAILFIINSSDVIGEQTVVPFWLLCMGGFGIACGIACLGKNVMSTLGERITKLNHTRGFSVDFSAATTVFLASNFGMPISTTHASVGAIVGVGLAKGFGAVDFRVLYKIFLYWLITIPISAFTCVILYFILSHILL